MHFSHVVYRLFFVLRFSVFPSRPSTLFCFIFRRAPNKTNSRRHNSSRLSFLNSFEIWNHIHPLQTKYQTMMQHKTNLAPKLYSPTSIITTDGGGGMFARSLSFSSSDASSDEKSHDGGRVTTPKSTATFPTRKNSSSQRPLIEFTFEKSSTNTNSNCTNTNNRIITIPDRLFVPTLWINLFRCAEKMVHHHGRARWLPHWWRRRHVCATSPTTPKSTATSSFLPILTLDLFGASRTSWTATYGRKQWRLQYIIDALNTCKLPLLLNYGYGMHQRD